MDTQPDTDPLVELWEKLEEKFVGRFDLLVALAQVRPHVEPLITAAFEDLRAENETKAFIITAYKEELKYVNANRDAALSRVAELTQLLGGALVAFQLTREYVGEDVLPAIEGWSWFDCVRAIEVALKGGACGRCGHSAAEHVLMQPDRPPACGACKCASFVASEEQRP